MTISRFDEVRLRTDFSSRVILGVIFLGMAAFSIYGTVVDAAGIIGVVLACACIAVWLYYATLEIVIRSDVVVIRRFWRSVWQAGTPTVSTEFALGGEARTHRCLRLHSKDEAHPFDMLQSLFGKRALEQAQLSLGSK